MKRILMATLSMVTLASASALAADLPQRPVYNAPAMVAAPVPMWTGCYLGGNVGGAFGRANLDVNGVGTVTRSESGFAAGGQVGCDYQFNGGWVIGARNMTDWTDLHSSGTFNNNAAVNFDAQWFDTLTARLGYAVVPNTLLYFQGGVAWSHNSANVTTNNVQNGQISNTRTGWTIGGGVEYMFAPNWSTFLEYNYMDFGSSATSAASSICPAGCSFSTNEQTILVGLNFRFH
jgi:outer membrane immunogenic protein